MKALIVFPLVILVGVALLAQMGLDPTMETAANQYSFSTEGYFDANGHQVLTANFTAVGEAGQLGHSFHPDPDLVQYYWTNATDRYQIYNSVGGVNIDYSDNDFSLSSSYGLIGVVIAMIALAGVVGISILSSGTTQASTIVICTAFLVVWGIFSFMSVGTIQGIPIFGVPFYFFLTLMYAIGIFSSISVGGTD